MLLNECFDEIKEILKFKNVSVHLVSQFKRHIKNYSSATFNRYNKYIIKTN